MLTHIIKLVWNRKRVNFLIILEIFVSFLVIFSVIVTAIYYLSIYSSPLGFDRTNVWSVQLRPGSTDLFSKSKSGEGVEITRRMLAATREFPEVDNAAIAQLSPYGRGNWNSCNSANGHNICFLVNIVNDSFADTMKLELVRGRWFSKEDDGAGYKPIVINEQLQKERYGNEDPIGKQFRDPTPDEKQKGGPTERVVGVVRDFRKNGELSELSNYVFYRNTLVPGSDQFGRNLIVKVKSGTSAAFEEKLIKRLRAEAPGWTFDLKTLDSMRDDTLKQGLIPLSAVGLVAAFLMIMVTLGLTGVLWQSVTQRTREIGLRRAKGATATRIYKQILAELVVIASAAVIPGILVVVQFPLLNFLGFATPTVFAMSVAVSAALVFTLTILCGLYPGFLATRVQPAEALHYE